MDTGKQQRLNILTKDAKSKIINPFEKHNWQCVITNAVEDGEFLLIQLDKNNITYKIGFLYSSATDNRVYKRLDSEVDLIIINGSFYHIESFAYGISTKVVESKNIQDYILEWNKSASNGKISSPNPQRPKTLFKEFNNRIQSENPINQIWSRIRQFKTKGLAEKLVIQRSQQLGITLSQDDIISKASGLAFCIQNGCDYFENAINQKTNQRIISLYYGAIAFASAEMLVCPNGAKSLQEVEDMTKFGHGLYTFDSLTENAFEGFVVGVLSNGFFKKWIEFLEYDVSEFPTKKPRKAQEIDLTNPYVTNLIDLFSRIPELEDLLGMLTENQENWLLFNYDMEANGLRYENRGATYLKITDKSCSKTVEDIAKLDLPLEQIEYIETDEPYLHFRALLNHPDHKYWHEIIKLHNSPFTATSYILPIFSSINEYRCIATVILYALSILVRYRPSIWRSVVTGQYENYLALTEEFLFVYERLAPEQFLESLLGTKLHVVQSGSILAVH